MAYKITPAQIQQQWLTYKAACDNHVTYHRYRNEVIAVPKPKIYSLESFCCLLGIERTTFEKLAKNRNYKHTVTQISNAILARKLDALVNGEGSAAGLIFDLKANYGLAPRKKAEEEITWDITMDLNDGNPPIRTRNGEVVNRRRRKKNADKYDVQGTKYESEGEGSKDEVQSTWYENEGYPLLGDGDRGIDTLPPPPAPGTKTPPPGGWAKYSVW